MSVELIGPGPAAAPAAPPVTAPGEEATDDIASLGTQAARDWSRWASAVGRSVVPVLEQLHAAMPTLTSAMLCTGDGFNIATIGVDEAFVGRLAALTASLHTVSHASVSVLEGAPDMDQVTLMAGPSQTVITAIEHPAAGHLLLRISAEHVTLGVLLVHTRRTAAAIADLLTEH